MVNILRNNKEYLVTMHCVTYSMINFIRIISDMHERAEAMTV
jgi:hypothetical protein